MSQALRGNFEVFNALGIEVDKTKSATDGFNEAFEKMVTMINGRARLSVQGVVGDVQGLKVTLEDAKQQLGKWEADVLTGVANVAESFADLVSRPELVAGIRRQVAAYDVLAASIERAIQAKETLGELPKEEAERMRRSLDLTRETMRGGLSDFDGSTSEDEMRAINQLRLPMAGAALQRLRQQLNPNRPKATPSAAAGPAAPAGIETPGLSEADINQFYDQLDQMDAAVADSINKQAGLRARAADIEDQQSMEALENFRNSEAMKQDLIDQTVLTMLEGAGRERAELEINHDRRIQQIQDTKFETEEQYAAVMAAEKLLYAEQKRRFEQAHNGTAQLNQSLAEIGRHAQELAASGLVDSIWSIADGSKSAGEAFRQFAASFGEDVSKMILKAYTLYAIQQLLGMFSGGGGAAGVGGGVSDSGSQFANFAAAGGQWTAMAEGGMVGVSSPTLLPKFNVLAGEAGREMLTVLARPSFERINGIPAQIGYAGGNRLAITSADALAGAGAGGMGGVGVLRVELAPGLIATLKEDSIKGARIAIVQDMSSDSQLSRVTRQKMA